MSIILIVALLLGGGASVAAGNAVPGDMLYPVKVNVNEGMRNVFAVSDSAEADLHARLAVRRLEEAERLSAREELSPDVRRDLQARFSAHADRVQERLLRLEERKDFVTALRLHSEFESSLRAHEEILLRISTDGSLTRREALADILVDVRSALDRTATARAEAEVRVGDESKERLESAAKRLHATTEQKFNDVRRLFDAKKATMSAEVIARVEASLREAENIFLEGEAQLRAESYMRAFSLFAESLRILHHVEIVIVAASDPDMERRAFDVDLEAEGVFEREGTVAPSENEGVLLDGSVEAGGSL